MPACPLSCAILSGKIPSWILKQEVQMLKVTITRLQCQLNRICRYLLKQQNNWNNYSVRVSSKRELTLSWAAGNHRTGVWLLRAELFVPWSHTSCLFHCRCLVDRGTRIDSNILSPKACIFARLSCWGWELEKAKTHQNESWINGRTEYHCLCTTEQLFIACHSFF